jgi:hypothetical protein
MVHRQNMSVLIHGGGCSIGGLSGAALRPGDWSKQLVATLSTTGSDWPGVCAECSSPASAADFNNRDFWASAELFYCRACWDQWHKTPRKTINSSISGANCPEVLLVVVGDNLASLSEMNLRTAIHRLGKIVGWGGPPKIATVKHFEGLLNVICETQLSGRSVSNIAHGLAKMKQQRRLGAYTTNLFPVMQHLDESAVRVAPKMIPQDVANTVWAYARLGRSPGEKALIALDAAAARVAPEMIPQDVANTVWAYAKLDRSPGKKALIALDAAAARVAPEMIHKDVANTVWAYASLGRSPGEKALIALDAAAARVAPEMIPQHV